ncbi:MAPK-activated protein kinase Srk1 [Malassezia cuniculi]|uniref:MAPK-activated protein kinase Srk1 n=1 Tax=Malassezia cuniculi TaxID=948313 RepID=A0AAF0ENL2_9BASI|nr:MAPK-activated protein kinase Srk1 [Malassezia cuniculi]
MLERLSFFVRHGKAAAALHKKQHGSEDGPIPVAQSFVTPAVVATATATPTFSETPYTAESAEELGREAIALDAAVRKSSRYTKEAEMLVAHEKEAAGHAREDKYTGLDERYELCGRLGQGTFSQVMRAHDKQTGTDVAIKIVSKAGLSHQGDRLDKNFREKAHGMERETVLKEVQIMRRAEHPNIVRLIDFSESDEYYFLVMELLDGGELFEQIVYLTYFSEPLTRHVMLQVAQAIRHLHEECGVVHRDIKPENLLFEKIDIIPNEHAVNRPYDDDKKDEGMFVHGKGSGGIGTVKLADFGLSKVVWEHNTKTPCGTVGYTAPEIVNDEHYSKAVDMWALGCVMYTLLCGFPPFYDESIEVLTNKVSKGEYSFLSPWWDDISESAKDLVANLLCIDPERRYTIDQFLAHEWCRGPTVSRPVPKPAANPATPFCDDNNPPRIGNDAGRLREAFDVTYAVHRIAEENAKRASKTFKNQPQLSMSVPRQFSLHMDDSTLLARRRRGVAANVH